jgi:integrase
VATQLIGTGHDIRTVSGRLGHAQTSTTLNTYAAFLTVRDREAANQLAAILDPEDQQID